MNNKGDLSINTVVIAALALVVLVVLVVIFGNQMRNFFSGVRDCRTLNGNCLEHQECINLENRIIPNTDCNDINKDTDYDYVCCVPLFNKAQ